MKPSPPVTRMLRTSGNGSKLPWPVNNGAARQTPSSMKNLDSKDAAAVQYQQDPQIEGSAKRRAVSCRWLHTYHTNCPPSLHANLRFRTLRFRTCCRHSNNCTKTHFITTNIRVSLQGIFRCQTLGMECKTRSRIASWARMQYALSRHRVRLSTAPNNDVDCDCNCRGAAAACRR